MKNSLTTQQLYDLFVIGLWRLRTKNTKTLARTGLSVMGAYACTPLMTVTERLAISKDYKLIGLAMQNAEIIDCKLPKRTVRDLVDATSKHLVVLRPAGEAFDHTRLFGARGYDQIITKPGMDYAARVEEEYDSLITPEKFFEGWETHKSRMRAMHQHDASDL